MVSSRSFSADRLAPLRPVASGLFAFGLLADVGAGLWVLDGQALPGLLIHVPAVLIWVCGVASLGPQPGGDLLAWLVDWSWLGGGSAASGRSERAGIPPVPGRLVAAALFGIVLLPGLGSASYSI